jgi:hypothetical protein
MLVRFVGGPKDGLVLEIGDGISEVRMAVTTGEISYWRTRWTRDGRRIFVVEGYDRSPIGDEEIDAAARWLAEREAAHQAHMDGSTQASLAGMLAATSGEELRRRRDRAAPEDSLHAWTTGAGHRYHARIAPGLALGYRDDEAEPCWRWPQVPSSQGTISVNSSHLCRQ